MEIWRESQKDLPVIERKDVVVCGGGPAGFGAALSAARNNCKVTIIEKYGFLGGMATASMVNLMAIRNLTPYNDETFPLIGGIPLEFLKRLNDLGGTVLPDEALRLKNIDPVVPSWSNYLLFDVELTKIVMAQMLKEANVTIRNHSFITGVVKENKTIKGVIIESKSGREVIMAERIIDATGDGDVAFFAGANFDQRLDEDTLPATMIFSIGGADDEKIWAYLAKDPELKELVSKAPRYISQPDFRFKDIPFPLKIFKAKPPKGDIKKYNQMVRPGQWWIWGLHMFNKNVVDAVDLSFCEMTLRERVYETFLFLKKELPGMDKAYLDQTPVQVGIRESRRFHGEYTLTLDDLLGGKEFEDGIARGRVKDETAPFHIPYRSLIPKDIEGLLLAGRCISLTHEAATQVAPRNQPTCMAIGQAAGVAAALSIHDNKLLRRIDVDKLKSTLISQGVYITGE
ncbi:MAG: hypothetical protein DRP55_04900 [Spirochaetes bacterium]|nr:MAG: hypothetical protein DRP55_04900 [Spirochaetota bacterium]